MAFKYEHIDIDRYLAKLIRNAVKKTYGIKLELSQRYIDVPKQSGHGVFSTSIAFQLAKTLKKKPEKIAEDLAKYMRTLIPADDDVPLFQIAVFGGFINFQLSMKYLLYAIENIYTSFGVDKVSIQSQEYAKKKIVIEYASPNPNKLMHMGHFRNIVIATPLINSLKLLGAKVYTDMVLNDKGIAISKAMVGYLYYGRKGSLFKRPKGLSMEDALDIETWYKEKEEWATPESANMSAGEFVDKLYVLGSALVKEDKEASKVAQYFVQEWELGNRLVNDLWELVIDWGIRAQEAVFNRLNCTFDTVWRESDHYLYGKRLVMQALKKGVLKVDKKEKKGAIVSDLTKQGLGKFVLLRSDGTSLYSTQDLALTRLKMRRYHANEYYWVVGTEQSTHFKQLFATLKNMGIVKNERLVHIAYALLLAGGKKASSRSGDAQSLEDFLDYIVKYIKDEFNLPAKDAEKLAIVIARVAVAKIGAAKAHDFDIKKASSVKGHTGAYLMYTYVRANNIVQKYDKKHVYKQWLHRVKPFIVTTSDELPVDSNLSVKDVLLIRQLAYLMYYLKLSVRRLDPSILVNYAFDLADMFNSYYEEIPVLSANKTIREFRLYLVHATKEAIKQVIEVLGGEVINKM